MELGRVPRELADLPEDGWRPSFESRWLDPRGRPMLTIRRSDRGVYRFHCHPGTEFFVEGSGCRLWVRWSGDATLDDAALYLLGPVLGFVLRLRGVVPLHASAVVIDGRAIAFAGPAGAGKSTIAAAFAQHGHQVLTDDTAALERHGDEYLVRADHPLVRLWPDALELLGRSSEGLPRLSAAWEKRYLDLERHGFRFERTPRPLSAVYVFDEETTASRRPEVRELRGREAFLALVANTYSNHTLSSEMRADEFDQLARLLSTIAVYRLRKPAAGIAPEALRDELALAARRHLESRQAARAS